MNCRRARGLFSEYHDGVLKADLEQEVSGHLSACPACRGEFKSFETGIRILKKLKPGRPWTGGDSGTAGHKD